MTTEEREKEKSDHSDQAYDFEKKTILHPLALNSKIQKMVNPNKKTVAMITDQG